jgi:hypothetical protein
MSGQGKHEYCNVFGYWRRSSDCQFVLLTTSLVITTINYNTIARLHNLQSRIPSSGMWRRLGILLTDVSEERIACIFSNLTIYNHYALISLSMQ